MPAKGLRDWLMYTFMMAHRMQVFSEAKKSSEEVTYPAYTAG
jgi:hypothetical protein